MTSIFRTGVLLLVVSLVSSTLAGADEPTGPRTVPDVVGLTQAEADGLFKQAGFEVSYEFVAAADVPTGRVVSQDPGGLAVRDAGTSVLVRVVGAPKAAEPTPPAVPATPRERTAVAPSEPPPAGPPSGEIPELPAAPAGPPPAVVTEPAPPAPTDPVAPPAEPAALGLGDLPKEPATDANGPALPNTFGMARQEAEQALAGYDVVMEVTLTSPDMQGRVVEQHPEPGQPLAKGEPVTLIFGLANEPGPEYRQVPALDGVTPEEAVTRLARAGGYVAVFCTVPSTADKAGRVVSSTPHRFSFLLKGEPVRVRLGRGSGEALPPPLTEPALPPAPSAPGTDLPPSGELPTPSAPTPAPSEPPAAEPVPVPSEPVPAPSEPPAGPLPVPGEPTPPPGEPAPLDPVPSEPAPTEPVPTEPPPAEPLPAPMPFPTQPPRPPPGVSKLTGPAEGDSFPKAYGPTFEWQTVPNADGYEWVLEAEAATGTWRTVREEKLIGTKFRPAQLEAARYRWRVRALSGEAAGDWTPYRRLFLY